MAEEDVGRLVRDRVALLSVAGSPRVADQVDIANPAYLIGLIGPNNFNGNQARSGHQWYGAAPPIRIDAP